MSAIKNTSRKSNLNHKKVTSISPKSDLYKGKEYLSKLIQKIKINI